MATCNPIDNSIRQHVLNIDGSHSPAKLCNACRDARNGFCFPIAKAWDLQRDRTGEILQTRPYSGRHGVAFKDSQSRRFERSMSVAIGPGKAPAYVGLLWRRRPV